MPYASKSAPKSKKKAVMKERMEAFKEGDMALSPTKGTGIIERTPEEQMFNKLVGMKSIREASMKKEAFEGAGLVKKNEEAKKGLVEKAVKIVDSGGTGGFAMQALFNEYAKLNAGDAAPLENAILYHMQSKQMDVGQNVQGIPSTTGKSLSRFMITEGTKRNEVKTHDGYPARQNPDGSYSTEVTITVTDPRLNKGRPTNIPSLWKGKEVDEDTAVTNVLKSKKMYPSYTSVEEAIRKAEKRSEAGGAGSGSPLGRSK